MGITLSFTLLFSLNAQTYAWHENLGIDNNKAAELYQTKPNEPAIVQWKNALQLAINNMDKCFDIIDFQKVIDCQPLILSINSSCQSHPNELIACNDARLPQYPSILKNAEQVQIKFEEEQKKREAANNELRYKFEQCLYEGGSIMKCKSKTYTAGNKSQ